MIINGIEETIPFGNFIIEKPNTEEVKKKTNFTGYDYMIKFNVPYKNRVTYPIPAGELFEDVCDQVGLEAGNVSFTNSNYMILGNPFTNNEDCRTVLSNLAQLAGGFAKIGRDNKPYIVSLKNISNLIKVKDVNEMLVKDLNLTIVKMLLGEKAEADEKLDGNNYSDDFSKNEQWGEMNSLILRISGTEGENTTKQDEESIEKNGLTELVIEDNYFLTEQAEREKVINPLWNNLKGIKYLPFKTTYYGYPYLDSGDIIYVQDTNDVGYISYVFNHTFIFNGAYSGTLEAPALTRTQTAYKNTINNKTRFRNVERKIDKINGIIEDVITEQTETSNKISQVEQTIDGITQTVSSVETTVEEVQGETESLGQSLDAVTGIAQNALNTANDAIDDLSDVKTTITTTTEKVTELEQSVDGFTQTVSSMETSIETINDKADNATTTANEAKTVSTTTSQKVAEIEQTVEGITQTVEDVETTLNENYSTTEETNSLIEQKAGEINLEVSNKIDNIQVGGTNLIPNSSPYNLENWHISNSDNIELTLADEATAPYGKSLRIRTLAQPTVSCGIYIIPTPKVLDADKEYCFSIWLKATANTNVTVGYARGGQTIFNVTTEWKKFEYKFTATAPTASSHGFVINVPIGTVAGRSVYIHSIKLEEGNQITAWSPAPEDDVKGSQIISSINLSSEGVTINSNKLNINGVISANGNFKVDTEGNLEANNAKFTGDIFLSSGKKVIGGDGMMTNLSFASNGNYKGFDLLGYSANFYGGSSNIEYTYGDVVLDIYIPDNFVITSAYVQLQHTPVAWTGYDDALGKDYNTWGYARNIKLYKSTGNQNYKFDMTYLSSFDLYTRSLSVSEIAGAFGNNGWTPSTHSGAIYEAKTSTDIKNSLTNGYQKLVIRCADGNLPTNFTNAAQRTGVGRAYINIIGYLS